MTRFRNIQLLIITYAAALALQSCRDGNPGNAAVTDAPEGPVSQAPNETALFVDIAAESGLRFVHCNGMSGQLYFIEPVGPGGALADLDNDGDLDVYLVQGGPLVPPGASPSDVAGICSQATPGGGRVFRNDLETDDRGQPRIRFTDVTAESGLAATGYGMGVAAGDFDNDGRIDLYLTSFGHNHLWRNVSDERGIRFVDVTTEADVDDPRWSTSAAFLDVDGDGLLDLFVANYVDFTLEAHRPCRSAGGRQDYCGPASYNGETDRLFRNRGDGTFDDVSGHAGLLSEPSSGLGAVGADFDLDGRLDVYVANDLRRNVLWRNLGSDDRGPRFENIALESGCAVSAVGHSQASMGVVAGDIDGDGDDDLFMTHLSADTNTLYVNDGHAVFDDRSASSGLGTASFSTTGFGTALFDVDRDGVLDVIVMNGAVKAIEAQARAGDALPLKEPNQLFRGLGDGTFEEISDAAGPEFTRLEVSRGVAVGDIDNDGRSDLLITNNHGPARLLRNQSPDRHGWLGLRLLTRDGRRDALGARVEVVRADGTVLHRRVATDGSYLSASDPRLLVGLGATAANVSARVTWPDGVVERWDGLAPGEYYTLQAGTGRTIPEV